MKLTAKMKKWCVDNKDVSATADDDEFRKAIGESLADGTLEIEKLNKLSTTKDDEEAEADGDLLKILTGAISDLTSELKKSKSSEKEVEKTEGEKTEGEKASEKEEEKEVKKPAKKAQPSMLEKMVVRMGGTPDEIEGEEKEFSVRVKEAIEMYSDSKSAMVYPERTKSGKGHALAGQPVVDFSESGKGRVMDTTSERSAAIGGAYAKFLCATAQRGGSRNFGFQSLPQHDKEILLYALENEKWGGATDGGDFADIKNRKLTPHEQKQLIDDAVSGGLEAAPIVFDDDVIQTPLLHGELFPSVNTVPLDKGRRVEGVITGTVTGTWGGVDDTAIALFATASYVTAFDTTIFRWEGAIRIGLDFLSDTPIDFGQHISSQYGERLLEDLDDVIATGNGTTQPEGVINKAGVTTIAWGGATTLGNYESTRFGVAKPEHRSNIVASAVFCGTETSYQRARALPVGATDARRLGGMDYSSYSWMERPFKINESLTNAQVFYAILAKYRMYRRRGLTIRTTTEGDTLVRRHEMLMVAMARYGGQLERGAVAAITTTAPA